MPNYQAIYDDIITNDERYNHAENSPGLRTVIDASERLEMLSGRSLDFGCGVGFVVEHLSQRNFNLKAFGVDVSEVAIERATKRLERFPGSAQRLQKLGSQKLPFEDNFFALVTSFDVLEHLDVDDIKATWNEIERVLRPGGVFFGSVSCRKSGMTDVFGDNLHRTVQSVDWWIETLSPERVEYDVVRSQLTIWKRATRGRSVRRPNSRPNQRPLRKAG